MSQPNFQAMNQADLRAYVLAHRDDLDAFHALADRLRSKPGRKLSLEEIERLPEILSQIRSEQENKND
jgi:hypothetical protein